MSFAAPPPKLLRLGLLAPLCLLAACAPSLQQGAEAGAPTAAPASSAPRSEGGGAASSGPATAAASPLPPLALQAPLLCPEDGFSARSIPAEAFDAAGLPLPASLCIGAKLAALPMLRGLPFQEEALGEGLVAADGPSRVYQVQGARLLLRLQAADELRVAGALLTPLGGEGFSHQATRAWLKALVPCATVPDLAASDSWYDELSSAKTEGFGADHIRLMATQRDDEDWRREQGRLLGRGVVGPQVKAPPGRWLGLVAMAYFLR